MKTLKPFVILMLAFSTVVGLGSCSKDDNPGGTGSGNGGSPDGFYEGTWQASGNQIPAKLQDDVASMVLTIDQAEDYSWKWVNPQGKESTFTGTIVQQKTEYKHTNGSVIWEINIKVTHINGQPAPGGWSGIYAYENPNTLLLNVEPAVDGVLIPLASQGLGTGSNGQDGIYKFSKVQ